MSNNLSAVSVVIPNYNGEKFLETCLKSLDGQSQPACEIILVDNGSSDRSLEVVVEKSPSVKIIALDKNFGFPHAVNVGIKASCGEFVVLLNNDTQADKDFIKNLLNTVCSDKKIFCASAKMLRYHERDIIDDAGDLYNILGWANKRGDGKSISKYCNDDEVFSACGGAAIYKRQVFDEIGLFDENFFAYLEDVDMSYRAKIAGNKVVFCASAIVYHIGSGTSGSKYNNFKVPLAAQNSIYVAYKNMPLLQLIINLPFLAFGMLVKAIHFCKIGFGADYIKGLKSGFVGIRRIKKTRFALKNVGNYLKIEIELVINLFKWIFDKMSK